MNIQIDDSEFPTRDINWQLEDLLNEKLEKVYAGKAANPFADGKDKNGKQLYPDFKGFKHE